MLLKIRYETDNLDFSKLMFIGCGSSILPLESQRKFLHKFGIKIGNLYGLSETGPTHIDDPRDENWIPGSIGKPLDVNVCKISEKGELLIKGDNVFIGYHNNMELYKEVFKDSWFFTGDIVSYENGVYVYKDRCKDLIIKGGINIVPAEVEEILYMHSDVHEAIVVGVYHEVHGEDLRAAISLKKKDLDKKNIMQQLYELLNANLSSYKHPAEILICDALPRTLSGKLKRRDIKLMWKKHDNR